MQPCYWPLNKLPGINQEGQTLLQNNEIQTTQDLLVRTSSLSDTQRLAQQLHLPLKDIQKWSALADLSRVPSIGCRYCGLLLHSGIISVKQLAQNSVDKLHPTVRRLCITTTRNRDLVPSPSLVQRWINEARLLSTN